jgi:hypothetical protein
MTKNIQAELINLREQIRTRRLLEKARWIPIKIVIPVNPGDLDMIDRYLEDLR